MLPPKYIGAVMLGNGISGISMSVLRGMCLLIYPDKDDQFKGTLIYFFISITILIMGAIA